MRLDRQMIFLKACPKCSGDILLDEDTFGRYLKCLQCGFSKDVMGDYQSMTGELKSVQELEVAQHRLVLL